jgi:hypothetical protein
MAVRELRRWGRMVRTVDQVGIADRERIVGQVRTVGQVHAVDLVHTVDLERTVGLERIAGLEGMVGLEGDIRGLEDHIVDLDVVDFEDIVEADLGIVDRWAKRKRRPKGLPKRKLSTSSKDQWLMTK